MQFLIVGLSFAMALPQTSRPLGAGRSAPVLVRAVIDGDTIDVASVGRVRLLGIDAPEIGHGLASSAPFAEEAKERLTSLLLHRWIRLEQDAEKLDAYNRHLAYVMTEDGQFVNALLVREGLARVSARSALARLDELTRAEREAQQSRRGIWGATPRIPSASYTPAAKQPADASRTKASPRKRSK